MDETRSTKTSPLLIAAAWAVVVLPTAWGFSYTLQNALKIFTAPTAASAHAKAPTPPAH